MEEKADRLRLVKSPLSEKVVFRIANFASASTLSNLHQDFFNQTSMKNDERMLKHVQDFCDDYQPKKKINAYGNYMLDIKGYDEAAQNHYIRFCDEHLRRQIAPNEPVNHTPANLKGVHSNI